MSASRKRADSESLDTIAHSLANLASLATALSNATATTPKKHMERALDALADVLSDLGNQAELLADRVEGRA